MLRMTRFLEIFHYHGPKFEKKIDLNSATSGVGLAEASKQLKMASAKSYPTGGRVQIKIFFFKFWSMAMEIFKNLVILSIASRIFKQKLFRGRALLNTAYT